MKRPRRNFFRGCSSLRMRIFPALAALLVIWCLSIHAKEPENPPGERLGAVSFPVSCAPEVRGPFERAVALLHSFEFEQADLQFQEVARQDQRCAMAYWGQAMSIYHQLWSRPGAVDLKDGWALVQQARRLKAGTVRERDYIEALAAFYGRSAALTHEKRVTAYAKAMELLSLRYPQDREAAVLYALALLSMDFDDPESTHRKKAIGLLQKLFEEAPEHPGVAHYLIHACDAPQFAALGLEAARRYAAIAPSSPHAVHMPSHIFARLGLWHDDVDSNLAALKAAKETDPQFETAHHRLHSMDFLEYAYLQIADDRRARAMVDEVLNAPSADVSAAPEYYDYARSAFPALFALETRNWKEALTLQSPPRSAPGNRAIVYWARAEAAGHTRNIAAARVAVRQYNRMAGKARQIAASDEAGAMETNRDEARAWLDFTLGKNDLALRRLRSVADDQDESGKGEVELPAREMLGDMLLELSRPAEALAEYEKSLRTDPNRFNGLYGAARAAELSGQPEKATGYYRRLVENCASSDSTRPELAQAKIAAKRN